MDKIVKGAAVLIIKESSVLLTKRLIEPYQGYWEVPAGHVKEGEDPSATVIREAEEEAGVKISSVKKLESYIDENYFFNCDIFLAEKFSGEARNLDEFNHSDLKWFKLDKLPEKLGPSTRRGLKLK